MSEETAIVAKTEQDTRMPAPMYFEPNYKTKVTDKGTGEVGIITHCNIMGDGLTFYTFAPERVNPKTCRPCSQILIDASRIEGTAPIPIPEHIPLQILGTTAHDLNSGIEGTIVQIILHPGGCIHVYLQQKNTFTHKGEPVLSLDFDLAQCRGEVLTDEVVRKALKPASSPMDTGKPKRLPLMPGN
jgi:hypothetical protein